MSAALRRRRLPVRIRPGTRWTGARSSIRRAPLSHSGGQGCNSPRVHKSRQPSRGGAAPGRCGTLGGFHVDLQVGSRPTVGSGSDARLDGHSRPEREGAGSNPAGAAKVETFRQHILARRRAEPIVDGYLGKTFGSTGFEPPASPPSVRGRSSVAEQVRRRQPVRSRTGGPKGVTVIASWVRIPAPPQIHHGDVAQRQSSQNGHRQSLRATRVANRRSMVTLWRGGSRGSIPPRLHKSGPKGLGY